MLKTYILFILAFLFSVNCISQEESPSDSIVFFSSISDTLLSIYLNPTKYVRMDDPSTHMDHHEALFDVIKGTYLDSFEFSTIDNKRYSTSQSNKPIFLHVTASWCRPCKAEIPSLNKIVEQYQDRVEFVTLFWDDRERVERLSKEYHSKMILIPSLTSKGPSEVIIAGFEHILGFPTSYVVLSNRKIVDVQLGASAPMNFMSPEGESITVTKEEAEKANDDILKDLIENLLISDKHLLSK